MMRSFLLVLTQFSEEPVGHGGSNYFTGGDTHAYGHQSEGRIERTEGGDTAKEY